VQAIIAIPDSGTLKRYGGTGALMRKVSGVPLLARVIKTAVRAGADSLLVIWPSDVPRSIWLSAQAALDREALCGVIIVQQDAFDPQPRANWMEFFGILDERFLWLPWNWVTNKKALDRLELSRGFPIDWTLPIHLERAAIEKPGMHLCIGRPPDGVAVTSARSAAEAERLLVAVSGKPPDSGNLFQRKVLRAPTIVTGDVNFEWNRQN
jgi:hypothetical protein